MNLTELREKSEAPEEWRWVVGYRGDYKVSSLGRVASTKRGKVRLLKPFKTSRTLGWLRVGLSLKNKTKFHLVHRLVLLAFTGKPPTNHQCAHLDGDPTNNRLENLKWVTQAENEAHKILHKTKVYGRRVHCAKLDNKDIPEIILKRLAGRTYRSIGKDYGVTICPIKGVCDRTRWTHVAIGAELEERIRAHQIKYKNKRAYTPKRKALAGSD